MKTAYRQDLGFKVSSLDDLLREFKPTAVAAIRNVDDPVSFLATQLNDRSGKIYGVRWTAALVVDHVDSGTGGRKFDDGVGKALSAYAEQPGCSYDAAIAILMEETTWLNPL